METMAEYRAMTTAQKTEVKDVGGFVGGHLKNGLRKKDAVLCRSMATVDLDFCPADVWETKLSILPFKLMCHSTHKHTPENPRLRVVLCFKREVTALEYEAIVRMLASEIGIDMFDPVSFMVHQLMFLPSYSADGEYFFREKEGIELDPDEYLAKYTNWQDSSTWPRTSNESKVVNHGTGKLADPRTKKGIVGAFCRAFPMSQAIEEFLSEEYEPTESPNRYHYKPADSIGGIGGNMLALGATYDEMVADYLTTYFNYYRITPDNNPDVCSVLVSIKLNPCLMYYAGITDESELKDVDFSKAFSNYLLSHGMTPQQLQALIQSLT